MNKRDAGCCLILARAAQALWCSDMEARGWRPGGYDAGAKTHDALVPFDDLGPADRRRLLEAVGELDLAPLLRAAAEHPRGPDRELTLDEMRPGRPVAYAEATDGAPGGAAEPAPALRGVIESWRAEGQDLILVRVRWADGTLEEFDPRERDLQRLGW